jgi:hypothetical protein
MHNVLGVALLVSTGIVFYYGTRWILNKVDPIKKEKDDE